jgi:hypothetical protein
MKMDVRRDRQALERRAVEQVASDALDPPSLELFAQAGFGKARDADDAPRRHRAFRHARERRAHLAAHAEHHDVSRRVLEMRWKRRIRRAHEFSRASTSVKRSGSTVAIVGFLTAAG